MFLHEKTAVSLEKTTDIEYIINLAGQNCNENPLLAASSGLNRIKIFNRDNLSIISDISDDQIQGSCVCFANKNPNLLFTSCSLGSIRCYDLRIDTKKQINEYQASVDLQPHASHQISINCEDTFLCAAFDSSEAEDVTVAFWDVRQPTIVGRYNDSFGDQITEICFHDNDSNKILIGAMDGLVSLFDISAANEEDALVTSLNLDASVNHTGFTGKNKEYIYATSHMDSICIWDGAEFDELRRIDDTKLEREDGVIIDYIVDCYDTIEQETIVLVGDHKGNLRQLKFTSNGDLIPLTPYTDGLGKGHREDIRCLHYHSGNGSLVTGGDDAMLCMWRDQIPLVKSRANTLKKKTNKKITKKQMYSKIKC